VGAKSGQSEKSTGRQRLWLVLFGALLVALFLVFAVAQGIGQPNVPEGDVAVIEEVPDEISKISEKELDRSLTQQIANAISQGELKKAPKAGSTREDELREAAMTELIERVWLQGEAEELGITVTAKQVENELEQIKEQNFPTPKAYKEFLESSKYTQEDVDKLVELQVFNNQIQERITAEATQPSNDEISQYYEAAKATQFTTKPSRDARIVTNKSKAKVEEALKELEADSSPANWNKVAKKFSEDPSTNSKGGLQEGLQEEILPEPLKADIFQAATGELIGPIKYQGNFTIVEVVKLNPEKAQGLGEVRAQISSQLQQQAQQEYFSEFVSSYQSKWTSRTFCASGFEVENCSNYKGSGHPQTAPPACYEADPEEAATECPAPVQQPAPAVPGSVTILQPQGERLPQRPIPVPSEEAAGGEAGSEAEVLEQLEEAGATGE
jgi:parvulin-like peptidyl-prolyl isomerase